MRTLNLRSVRLTLLTGRLIALVAASAVSQSYFAPALWLSHLHSAIQMPKDAPLSPNGSSKLETQDLCDRHKLIAPRIAFSKERELFFLEPLWAPIQSSSCPFYFAALDKWRNYGSRIRNCEGDT